MACTCMWLDQILFKLAKQTLDLSLFFGLYIKPVLFKTQNRGWNFNLVLFPLPFLRDRPLCLLKSMPSYIISEAICSPLCTTLSAAAVISCESDVAIVYQSSEHRKPDLGSRPKFRVQHRTRLYYPLSYIIWWANCERDIFTYVRVVSNVCTYVQRRILSCQTARPHTACIILNNNFFIIPKGIHVHVTRLLPDLRIFCYWVI